MKLLLNIFLIVLVVLFFLDLFMWGVAIGSGHNLPKQTTNSFQFTLIILATLIIIILIMKKKIAKKAS
jgi:preprotein translocase subunit SecE